MPRFNLRRLLFDRDTLSLMGLGLMVKPVGLVTQMLIAKWFGAGEKLDAYQLAFFLVTFGHGTLSRIFKGALAPHLIQKMRTLESAVFARYQNGVVGLFLGAGALWIVLLTLSVRPLIGVVWPGLPELTSQLTVQMQLAMAVPAVLLISNNLTIAVLNLHQHFRVAGAMPVLNSVCVLGALVLWHDSMGIWSLPAGFALAQVVRWPVIHLRALICRAWRPVRPSLNGADMRLIRELVALMAISELLLTVNLFLDRWFATGLEAGSISSLHYAFHLTNTVVVLFATSLITVMFPRMSAAIAAGDLEGCSRDIRANLKRAAHIVVPAAVMVAVAAPEIVYVLFQRGEFDATDGLRTSGTMAMYALGLPALVINGLVARVFHSLQLLRDKVWLSVQYLATNALLNAALIGPLKVRGLALASTVAIVVHLALSLYLLHRRHTGLATGQFTRIVSEAFLIGGLTMGVYWLLPVAETLARFTDPSIWTALGLGIAKGAVVAVIYVVFWFILWAIGRSRR